MQRESTGSSSTPSESFSGGAPPPVRNTRYNTKTMPPPKIGGIIGRLFRRADRVGFANKNELVSEFRAVDRIEYAGAAGHELFRFLQAYGVVYQRSGRWHIEGQRFLEVQIACDNTKPLPYDFVVGTVPGAACGCPQGSTATKPASANTPTPSAGVAAKSTKPTVIKRMAYVTHMELHALTAIDAGLVDGEFRSPMHMDDEGFRTSEFGQLFGWPREVFAGMLSRFVEHGLITVLLGTDSDSENDTLSFATPFKEITFVEIVERPPQALPAFAIDLIERVLSGAETSFKGSGFTAAVRETMVRRMQGKFPSVKQPETIINSFIHRLFHYNVADPTTGWGLVMPGTNGADVTLCFPGFGPTQFVPDSDLLKELMPRGGQMAAPAPKPSAPTSPRLLMAADVTTEMDDDMLDRILAETPLLIEAARTEKERRAEKARKAALRADLERRLKEKQEAAAIVAAEQAALEAELAML